ncbi:YfhO family protein [Kitasatospora sp. NPDC057223]|uniref:YfhO family protein n=1 Tax=Kitasatospora sp. NPDC057223 TaxID=3346055 RepID=UPI00362C19F9
MSETTTRRREAGAAGIAAVLAAGAYSLAAAVRGTAPFGGRSPAGALTDVAVPMHTHLWDLLHGETSGDLLFNWGSGFGTPFLPDLVADLTNPFSLLVGLLPRSSAALAVFLATLLTIGLGAALMTYVLGRLHPGPPLLRALLAVGYGVCAWATADGAADPAWLWGLVSLPLLCLAGDWCLHERRWVPGTVCVAVAWVGSLYTAVMATVAAGLVLLVRLVVARPGARAWLRVTGRAVTAATVGGLIASPVLFVTVTAAQDAQPAQLVPPQPVPGPVAQLAQLLPGGHWGAQLPDVAVGMLGLLLAAGLPFNRRVRVRERVAWCTLPALAGVSLFWKPDVLLWHGLPLPAGGPYRVAFVLSGLLVMAAWVSLSHRPDPLSLLGGAGLVLLLAALAQAQGALRATAWLGTPAGAAVVVAALWALERLHTRRRASAWVAAGLAGAVFGGAVWSAYATTGHLGTVPTRAGAREAAHRVIRAAEDWPRSRTDPGPHAFTANDPLLLGGEGGAYASAGLPADVAQTLHDLGAGWTHGGGQVVGPDDPVGRALFGVTTYLADGPPPDGFTARRATALPLVTVLPAGAPDISSVWARRGSLLGGPVYDVPELAPAGGPAPALHGSSGWSVPATPPGSAGSVLAGSCPPGSTAYVHSLWFHGTVSALGSTFRSDGSQPSTAVGVRLLGPVPADGRVELLLRTDAAAQIPARPVGCLRADAFDAAVQRLTATGGSGVTAGGHSISAVLPAGSTGTAVLSVPAVRGWVCSAGGPYAAPLPVLGLIGVPLGAGAGRVSCSYRSPGLAPGLVLGSAAAGVVALVTATHWPRRRPVKRAPGARRRKAAGPAPSA